MMVRTTPNGQVFISKNKPSKKRAIAEMQPNDFTQEGATKSAMSTLTPTPHEDKKISAMVFRNEQAKI